MDVTKLFKATIKTVRLRRKGLAEKSEDESSIALHQKSKESRKRSGFQNGSAEVVGSGLTRPSQYYVMMIG